MNESGIYAQLKEFLRSHAEKNNLLQERVVIKGRILTSEEAIGNPQRRDFPLLKGKEKLIQADFKGAAGQAFTDSPGNFEGTLAELLAQPVNTHFEKASFIAVLNAVMRHLGLASGTIHCKDEEPSECAEKLVLDIKREYGVPRIAMIGLQPALLEACGQNFPVRVVDLDPDNIGAQKCGVLVEDASTKTREIIDWADLVLVTGSTVANGSIVDFIDLPKPAIFYGTTIAGATPVLGLLRHCWCSK